MDGAVMYGSSCSAGVASCPDSAVRILFRFPPWSDHHKMQHARCVSIPDTTLIAVAAMPRVLHVMDRNFHRRTDAIDRSGESHLKMASLSLPSGLSALWHSVRHQIIGLNRWADNVFVITDSSKSCWLVDLTYPSKTFGRTVLDVSVSRHSSTLVSGQDHNTFNDEIVEIATKRPRLTPENTVSTKESNCAKIYKIQANALRKIDIEDIPSVNYFKYSASVDSLLMSALAGDLRSAIFVGYASGKVYSAGLGNLGTIIPNGLFYDMQCPVISILAMTVPNKKPQTGSQANTIAIVGADSILVVDVDQTGLCARFLRMSLSSTVYSAIAIDSGLVFSFDNGCLACVSWAKLQTLENGGNLLLDKSGLDSGWFKLWNGMTSDVLRSSNCFLALNIDGRCAEIHWEQLSSIRVTPIEVQIKRLLCDLESLDNQRTKLVLHSQINSESASRNNVMLNTFTVSIPINSFQKDTPWSTIVALPVNLFPLCVTASLSYVDTRVDVGDEPLYISLLLHEQNIDIFAYALPSSALPTPFVSFDLPIEASRNGASPYRIEERVTEILDSVRNPCPKENQWSIESVTATDYNVEFGIQVPVDQDIHTFTQAMLLTMLSWLVAMNHVCHDASLFMADTWTANVILPPFNQVCRIHLACKFEETSTDDSSKDKDNECLPAVVDPRAGKVQIWLQCSTKETVEMAAHAAATAAREVLEAKDVVVMKTAFR
ncbi:hypothetical protein BSLG_009185 [Batrachochytrium salamandrivorans]|nr:hypothetical protein BSLG_009185 [Batrachochytrium salamandrivorans]